MRKTQSKNLKSSMDRFIGIGTEEAESLIKDLKSSMDRFIVFADGKWYSEVKFKIQYG